MAKTHVIDGKTYVEVERQAELGEKVIIVNPLFHYEDANKGDIFTVKSVRYDCSYKGRDFLHGIDVEETDVVFLEIEYLVLEPVASEEWPPLTEAQPTVELTANDIRWQPERVIDLLANLARRVSSLERQNDDHLEALEEQSLRITSLERQLSDTQNNVIRQAEELAANEHSISELYGRLAHVEADVESVEERTASHRDELNVIDHEKAMIFEDIVSLSKRIKKLNGGAAE